MRALRSKAAGARHTGFGVLELMVAMTLSLLLLSGVIALFASARRSYEGNEHLGRIQENGRFALDMLQRDVRGAGYLGCAKGASFTNTLSLASNSLLWNFRFPVQGFESTGTGWSPALDTTVVPSAAAVDSDVLMVRTPDADARSKRLTALMATPSSALNVAPAAPAYEKGQPVIVTDCSTVAVFEVTQDTGGVISHTSGSAYSGGAGQLASAGNTTDSLGYAFTQNATVLPVNTVVYYVRASGTAGNGNSLWRRVGRNVPEELVEGVDTLQVLYGVDTNADRIVDDYITADAVTNWDNIVGVRIGLLLRSLEQYGSTPDTEHRVLDVDVAAAGDRRERLQFTTTIALRNEAL